MDQFRGELLRRWMHSRKSAFRLLSSADYCTSPSALPGSRQESFIARLTRSPVHYRGLVACLVALSRLGRHSHQLEGDNPSRAKSVFSQQNAQASAITITGLNKTLAAMINHCFQIGAHGGMYGSSELRPCAIQPADGRSFTTGSNAGIAFGFGVPLGPPA